VEEASMNVIQHGYAGMNPGSLILELELFSDQVVLTLSDFGHPFEPSAPPAPQLSAALEDIPVGGFGLFLIYQTMDRISYRSSDEGNNLTLIKKLTSEP
jgi:serine/threonine-protein kinase RsbW